MEKSKQLVVVGDTAFAEVAYEYFTHDSPYRVAAFSVEQQYRGKSSLFGLPVVPFETLDQEFPPQHHEVFVAVVYTQLNRLRARLSQAARSRGYRLASYHSSRAFIWPNVRFGEHCFVFENNVVQPFVEIGNNVVLWSGNHIGHHSVLHDNCFISSHVVLSGYVEVGRSCFLGVNSAVANNIKIAPDCWIGPGVTITQDTEAGKIYPAAKAEPAKAGSLRFFKVSA
jgi:sugar O-acyltransferase (sialic acid O-acetyltransferase NeuD family)